MTANEQYQQLGHHLDVPKRIRSLVYIVGMLGFPIVVAGYVLVTLSNDLKNYDRTLSQLAMRIDERPMDLDKTEDFIGYICESLRHELRSGVPDLVANLELSTRMDRESLSRSMTRVTRQIEVYIRPIVRRHQRFASESLTVGGNLGVYFALEAPAEPIDPGNTEAYLAATVSKNFGESLVALIVNNIHDFGDKLISTPTDSDIPPELQNLFGIPQESTDSEQLDEETHPSSGLDRVDLVELIDRSILLELTYGAIDTATTALHDQMLQRVRLQSSTLSR